MRHIDVERWSRGSSPLHRWDARMKVPACVLLIAAISAAANRRMDVLAVYAIVVGCGLLLSRLPVPGLLARAAIVLPFSAVFSVVSLLAGDPERAIAVPVKSYLSSVTALLLIGTTTLPTVLRALATYRVPRIVLLVTQFVYRYLFVLFEQAASMKRAASCRGGGLARGRSLFQAATGTLAVLFGKSYDRAERIHNAMVSRGFSGSIAALTAPALRIGDAVAFVAFAGLIVTSWIVL